MIPEHMLPHSVQRIRPTETTNSYGDTDLTYNVPPATSTDIRAWVQQQRPREVITDGRQAQVRDWLMLTNEQGITSQDRVKFGDLTFEVDGPPAPVYTPAGFHHTEANLKLVEG